MSYRVGPFLCVVFLCVVAVSAPGCGDGTADEGEERAELPGAEAPTEAPTEAPSEESAEGDSVPGPPGESLTEWLERIADKFSDRIHKQFDAAREHLEPLMGMLERGGSVEADAATSKRGREALRRLDALVQEMLESLLGLVQTATDRVVALSARSDLPPEVHQARLIADMFQAMALHGLVRKALLELKSQVSDVVAERLLLVLVDLAVRPWVNEVPRSEPLETPVGTIPADASDPRRMLMEKILEHERPRIAALLREEVHEDIYPPTRTWNWPRLRASLGMERLEASRHERLRTLFWSQGGPWVASMLTHRALITHARERLSALSQRASKAAQKIEALSQDSGQPGLSAMTTRQKAWTRGEIRDLWRPWRELVVEHLPDAAGWFTQATTKMEAHMRGELVEEMKEALRRVARVQHEFREADRDGNGKADYWTADVSGLFRLEREGDPLGYLPELSKRDADPLPDQEGLAPMQSLLSGGREDRNGRSFFALQVVELQADGSAYAQDTDGSGKAWRNEKVFAVCAVVPRTHPSPVRFTYLTDQSGRMWFMDTGGAPVKRFPSDPGAAGWMLVEGEAARDEVGDRR